MAPSCRFDVVLRTRSGLYGTIHRPIGLTSPPLHMALLYLRQMTAQLEHSFGQIVIWLDWSDNGSPILLLLSGMMIE